MNFVLKAMIIESSCCQLQHSNNLSNKSYHQGTRARDLHILFKQHDPIRTWAYRYTVVRIRGVNRAEISGPARKICFSARPGPARNQCIIKFVL